MSDVVKIEKVSEVFVKIIAERHIINELYNKFSFRPPNFQFHPAYKAKAWDGWMHMINLSNHLMYYGLVPDVVAYCLDREFDIQFVGDFSHNEFSRFEAEKFAKNINLTMEPRDYQIETLIHAVRDNRGIFLCPTGSGKSLSIYLITQYYKKQRILLIVPLSSLVHQMYNDFINYGGDRDEMYLVGSEKNTDKRISITTWQSIYSQPKEFFSQFDVVIGDEVHGFVAKSLKTIMENLTTCKYRFGFTGTLDDTKVHELVLQGLFGHKRIMTTTKKLVDEGFLTKPIIKAIMLEYSSEDKMNFFAETAGISGRKLYEREFDFLNKNGKRNRFLTNLALSLPTNTLILVNELDHADILEMLIQAQTDRPILKVTGALSGKEKDEARKYIETINNGIIIATKVFSIGINITRLHNLILARPTKSKIRVLQSLGRGLRLHDEKEVFTVFDIADDLIWNERKNFTLQHAKERVKAYKKEDLTLKIYSVKLQ